MKTKLLTSVAFIAGLLTVCGSAFAHHGASAYDTSKPLTMKDAVVTKYSWINPHVLIYFDSKDDKGDVQHWTALMVQWVWLIQVSTTAPSLAIFSSASSGMPLVVT